MYREERIPRAYHIVCSMRRFSVFAVHSPAGELWLTNYSGSESGGNSQSLHFQRSCIQAFISLLKSLPSLSPEILSLLTNDLSDPCSLLRETTLRALAELGSSPLVSHPPLEVALLVARHDLKEENRTLAERLDPQLLFTDNNLVFRFVLTSFF